MLLESYQNHPEAKSLGPDGKPCAFDTRGLLQRSHIVANWPLKPIGKESDKHWEEGEDLSLLDFKAIEYRRKGNAVATDEQLEKTPSAVAPNRSCLRSITPLVKTFGKIALGRQDCQVLLSRTTRRLLVADFSRMVAGTADK
jgi:hypothetical protein